MATQAVSATLHVDQGGNQERRFFFTMACVMAFVLVAGFSTSVVLRSTFASPIIYHIHAFTFFG